MSKEEKELAIASMNKKDKRLYDKIKKIKRAKKAEVHDWIVCVCVCVCVHNCQCKLSAEISVNCLPSKCRSFFPFCPAVVFLCYK